MAICSNSEGQYLLYGCLIQQSLDPKVDLLWLALFLCLWFIALSAEHAVRAPRILGHGIDVEPTIRVNGNEAIMAMLITLFNSSWLSDEYINGGTVSPML